MGSFDWEEYPPTYHLTIWCAPYDWEFQDSCNCVIQVIVSDGIETNEDSVIVHVY